VVNHVDEMENPRAIRTADGHVRVDFFVRKIEIDFAADQIVDDNMLAGRTKPQRALVVEDVTGILQFLQITLVNFVALALKIGPEISADVRPFIPIQPEPSQSFINGRRGLFGVAGAIGIFHSQHKCPTVMPSEKPVKERGSRPADVQISRWRRGETNADFVHLSVILSESEGSRKLSLAAGSIGFARDDG